MVYGIRNRTTESWLKRVLTQAYYRILNLSSPIDIQKVLEISDFLMQELLKPSNSYQKNRYMKGLYAWVGFKV